MREVFEYVLITRICIVEGDVIRTYVQCMNPAISGNQKSEHNSNYRQEGGDLFYSTEKEGGDPVTLVPYLFFLMVWIFFGGVPNTPMCQKLF